MDNWGWIYQLQNFADTLHITWDDALEKSVVEFFNVLAYLKDKCYTIQALIVFTKMPH